MPESSEKKTRIDYIQRLVQLMAFLRAIETLWRIGAHIGSEDGKTAASPLERALAAVIQMLGS